MNWFSWLCGGSETNCKHNIDILSCLNMFPILLHILQTLNILRLHIVSVFDISRSETSAVRRMEFCLCCTKHLKMTFKLNSSVFRGTFSLVETTVVPVKAVNSKVCVLSTVTRTLFPEIQVAFVFFCNYF